MPKRATIIYSSEDAPNQGGDQLFVYYCQYTGKHALTIDCDIATLPKRAADGSTIIDTAKHLHRLYTTDGPVKIIKRKSGKIERQYRLNINKLPIGYKESLSSPILYLFPKSLSSSSSPDAGQNPENPDSTQGTIPSCITPLTNLPAGLTGCQIIVQVEDKGDMPSVLQVGKQFVAVQVEGVMQSQKGREELTELISHTLHIRTADVELKSSSNAQRWAVQVRGINARSAVQKLHEAVLEGVQIRGRVAAME